jgi:hypothetical protein
VGVDWYPCNSCGETFPDAGYYVSCECGENWCSDDCAEGEGYRKEEDGFTPIGSKWSQDTSCNYCRCENHTDATLLQFCLDQLGKSREQIIMQYNNK